MKLKLGFKIKNEAKKRPKIKFFKKKWNLTNPPGGKIKKSPNFEKQKNSKNSLSFTDMVIHKNVKMYEWVGSETKKVGKNKVVVSKVLNSKLKTQKTF